MKTSVGKFLLLLFFLNSFYSIKAQVKYSERNLKIETHQTNQMDEATLRQKMKADGLTDPVIDKLIAQRKLWTQKQKGNSYSWMSAKNNNGPNPIPNAPCQDLGVENGWGAWQWQNGTNSGANPPVWSGSPAANPSSAAANPNPSPFYSLTSGTGIDCNTPGPNPGNPTIPVVCPGFGNSSIKIGDDCGVGSQCNQLTYPLTVTAQDTNFVFAYAVVIEDAGHLPNEQPYCEIVIYDPSGNPIQCVPLIYTGGANIPGFYPVNSASCCAFAGVDQYKPWTLVGVNLNQYVGQNLTVVITNCDCIYGGHFCYSYWDFLCGTASLSAGCFGNQSSICGPVDPQIAYTYQWYQNGNAIPPPQGTQQCITITPNPGDTITVAVHQPSGCDFHLTYVPASIFPSFTNTGTCGTYTFSNTSTASPASVSITGYSWTFQGGNPATASTPSAVVTWSTPGTYTVALTVTCSAGCTATTQTVVTVNALPTAQAVPSPACIGVPITLTNASISPNGDPITQWNWSMPGGNPTAGTGTVVTTTYPGGGPYVVTLTVTTQQGCTNTTSVTVQPYNPPVAGFTGNGAGCVPVCVNFADASTITPASSGPITSWQWSFPGGTPSSFSGQSPPQICYNNPGNYGASLQVTTQYGCTNTISITPLVNVYAWPNADFSVNPQQTPATDPLFHFGNLWSPLAGSDSVVAWTWDFGDGTTLSGSGNVNMSPQHSYSASITGNDFYNYTVCLRVQNQHGCWDSICHPVEILPEYEFYIPNTFTPNQDYHNETFFGKCRGVKDYNIWIFDRWGNLLWTCSKTDSNVPWDEQGKDGLSSACQWDGKVQGGNYILKNSGDQLLQEDVYVWKVKLTDVFDQKHTYVGNVNIVR